jgi:SH3-like domain-containing protein
VRNALSTALALVFATQAPASAFAQVELKVGVDVHARPGGPMVASLMPGLRVTTGPASGADTPVTFEGWIDASRLGARRDSFPASVSGRATLRLRAAPSPNGTILAVLQPGTGLHMLGRQGTWARVRRTAWANTAAMQPRAATSSATLATSPASPEAGSTTPAPAAAPTPVIQGPASRSGNAYVASSGARFRDLPVGKALGGLTAGSTVEIIARQNGWVRVRADGWVPEREIVGRDSAAAPDITAADLRADPQGMRGRVVQWEVEVMSMQIADPLRSQLERDEPYLLARGPGAENAILYIAVPQSLLPDARGLAPLARVHITARVRHARSEPAGTPVLDLLSIAKR